jgi:hypothetical protein
MEKGTFSDHRCYCCTPKPIRGTRRGAVEPCKFDGSGSAPEFSTILFPAGEQGARGRLLNAVKGGSIPPPGANTLLSSNGRMLVPQTGGAGSEPASSSIYPHSRTALRTSYT